MLAASARSTQRKRTAPMRYMKTHQQTPASLFRPAACYRFRLLPIHFEPERLPHRGRARQLPGAPLRRSTSPDARCSMKVSVHEFHSFIASFALTNARSTRTRALCANTTSSSFRLANTLARLSRLFFVFFFIVECSTLLDGWQEDNFFVCFKHPEITAIKDHPFPHPYLSLEFFVF